MGKKRLFTTAPIGVIGDRELHALDLRVLLAISLHDGMSEIKGGPGCYASYQTLADRAGTDIPMLSRVISKLERMSYIRRERQQKDKRRWTIRVHFADVADSCAVGQQSDRDDDTPGSPDFVDPQNNDRAEHVVPQANEPAKVVANGGSQNTENASENFPNYTSLNDELDFVKTKELNSPKGPQFENCGAGENDSSSIIPISDSARKSEKNTPEGGCSSGFTIAAHVADPRKRLPDSARLSRIEAALGSHQWRVDEWKQQERVEFEAEIMLAAEAHYGTPTGYQAERIIEMIDRNSNVHLAATAA